MSEEKKLILNMLKEGKISDEEALRLLEAIGEKEKPSNAKFDFKSEEKKFEKKASQFMNNFTTGVENFLGKIQEGISNIDINLEGVNFSSDKYSQKTEKKFTLSDVSYDTQIEISNINGKIEAETWDEEYGELVASISYDDKKISGDYEFIKEIREDNKIKFIVNSNEGNNGSKYFDVKFVLYLPKGKVESILLESVNGKVTTKDLVANTLEQRTVNGKIISVNNNVSNVHLETVNGKVEVDGGTSNNLIVDVVNGKISITELNAVKSDINNTNGSIYIDEVLSNSREINVDSSNGGIYFIDLNYTKPIKIESTGRNLTDLSENFTNLEKKDQTLSAYTHSYSEELEDKLFIKTNTVFGKVKFD